MQIKFSFIATIWLEKPFACEKNAHWLTVINESVPSQLTQINGIFSTYIIQRKQILQYQNGLMKTHNVALLIQNKYNFIFRETILVVPLPHR